MPIRLHNDGGHNQHQRLRIGHFQNAQEKEDKADRQGPVDPRQSHLERRRQQYNRQIAKEFAIPVEHGVGDSRREAPQGSYGIHGNECLCRVNSEHYLLSSELLRM